MKRRLPIALVLAVLLACSPASLFAQQSDGASPSQQSAASKSSPLYLGVSPELGVGVAGGDFLLHFNATPVTLETRPVSWFGLRTSPTAHMSIYKGFQVEGIGLQESAVFFLDVPLLDEYRPELFAGPSVRLGYDFPNGYSLGRGFLLRAGLETGLALHNGAYRMDLGVQAHWPLALGSGSLFRGSDMSIVPVVSFGRTF